MAFFKQLFFILVCYFTCLSNPVTINIVTGQPSNLWYTSKEAIQNVNLACTAFVCNTSDVTISIEAKFSAFDFNGNDVPLNLKTEQVDIIAKGNKLFTFSLLSTYNKEPGPIYVVTQVTNKSTNATTCDTTTIGIMLNLDFVENSKFGISTISDPVERDSTHYYGQVLSKIGAKSLRNNQYLEGIYTYKITSAPIIANVESPNSLPTLSEKIDFIYRLSLIGVNPSCFVFGNEWDCQNRSNAVGFTIDNNIEYLKALAQVREDHYPNRKIAITPITSLGFDYLTSLISHLDPNVVAQYDVLDFHPFGGAQTPDINYSADPRNNYLGSLQKISYINNHSFARPKELWLGEFYANTWQGEAWNPESNQYENWYGNNDNTASVHLTLEIVLALAANIDKILFHMLDDNPAIESSGPAEPFYGLFKPGLKAPKGLAWAYQTAAYFLGDATFLGEISLHAGHRGLLFNTSKGQVAIIWNRKNVQDFLVHPTYHKTYKWAPWASFYNTENKSDYEYTISSSGIKIFDCIGRAQQPISNVNGMVKFKITGAPIYILGGNFRVTNTDFQKIFTPRKKSSFLLKMVNKL